MAAVSESPSLVEKQAEGSSPLTIASASSQNSIPPMRGLPDVPDGGWRAWLVVFGSSITLFASFGVVNAYGVFETYYQSNRLSNENSSIIALIGAIQLFLLYGLGPFFGKIFDSFGVSIILPVGAFCIVFAQMMLSLTQDNQTYQYFLSQAVLFGIGSSMVFMPALAIISHYFRKRRGIAFGFVAMGSSLGGVIFPVIYQRLFVQIDFPWSVRTTGFICLSCLALSCLTMKTRLPLKPTTTKEILRFIDLGGFKDPRYCCAAASAFFTFYAIFIPYFYIERYARLQGMSDNMAQYLLPIINAATVPSRLLPGLIADKTGPLNLLVPMTLISGILCLALWLPARSNTAIILFAVFYGLFSGQFVSLLPTYIAKITPQPVYGARLGAVYLVVAVANLVGTPTGGGIVKGGTLSEFSNLIVFTGVMVSVGGLLMAAAWLLEARRVIRETPHEKRTWRSFRY